jgi:cobaltochelatase CobT
MSEAQVRARQQQLIEELCAASIRALSGIADLHFRGARLHHGRRALPRFAPHLHPRLGEDDFASFRGAADGLALRLAHSDAQLHRGLAPADPVERLLFELLEQFRTESLALQATPGVRRNLRHRFEAWSLGYHHSGGTESARGLLLYTVTQVCRARVTGESVVEETEDLLEATRAGLAPRLGVSLAGLRREREDQAAYAVHALAIARDVAELLKGIAAGDDDAKPDDDTALTDPWAAFSLLLDQGDQIEDPVATAVSGRSLVLDGHDGDYRIFTTAHDREVAAITLARPEQLRELRERLDAQLAASGVNLAHLARDLKALLAVPSRDGWDSGQEEGLIDGRRLAQLISSPTERRLFRSERRSAAAYCRATLLIDCSGSMKEHSESVAVLADLLARAFEQIGVASEVLGFTTNAWNGGRAQRDWVRAGRPTHPGRLNEACHIVFKDVDTPWRRARPAIAALLKGDLFREGIDGEALEWAVRRLHTPARDHDDLAAHTDAPQRRLVFVVSDGSPMDSATNLANDAHYLDQHLRDVVAKHERAGIEIYGVGVGLDLSPYYSRSQVLDLSAGVGSAVLRDVLGMLGRARQR